MFKQALVGGMCLAMLGCAGPSPEEHDAVMFWDCNRQGPMGLGRVCRSAADMPVAKMEEPKPMEPAAPQPMAAPAESAAVMAGIVAEQNNEPMPATAEPTLTDAERILQAPADWYAVQVIALSKPGAMEAFVEKYNFQDRMQVTIDNKGQPIKLLILGMYQTMEEAVRAVSEIPVGVGVEPWIRPVGNLQDAVRASQ